MHEAAKSGLGDAGELLRWFRVIEAETLTRRRSTIRPVNDWLSLEWVDSELSGLQEKLVSLVLSACDQVVERLGCEHGETVLLTVLASETESPWSANPYGYCVSKEPYEKICLPWYLVDDPEELFQAVAHEYAHVVSASLSDGNASRWLEEAISVLLESKVEPESRVAFLSGEVEWLSPGDLEMSLEGRRDDTEEEEEAIWYGYQQAGWIGRYLVSLGNERRLGELLREIADEGFLKNLVLTLRNRDRVDGALERLYKMDAQALFEAAFLWMAAYEGQ